MTIKADRETCEQIKQVEFFFLVICFWFFVCFSKHDTVICCLALSDANLLYNSEDVQLNLKYSYSCQASIKNNLLLRSLFLIGNETDIPKKSIKQYNRSIYLESNSNNKNIGFH